MGSSSGWRWEQSNKELSLLLDVEADVRAKEVRVNLTSQALRVVCREKELVAGTFFLPVKPDDSLWELEPKPGGGKQIRFGLSKLRPNMQWDCLFMSEVDDSITHRVFMDIAIGGKLAGRVTFGLHGNACPKTVENFRCLCTGEKGSIKLSKKQTVRLHYEGTKIHRVVPGFLIQGGDVTNSASGAGGVSIYGGAFDDENFKIKHTGAGQLLMAHFGIANNNQSQFAVAMDKITEFESKHVIFGKVLDGMDVLRVVELEGSGEGFTSRPVVIVACGEIDAEGREIEEVRRTDDEVQISVEARAEAAIAEAEEALARNRIDVTRTGGSASAPESNAIEDELTLESNLEAID